MELSLGALGRLDRYLITIAVVLLAFFLRLVLETVLGGSATALLMVPAIVICSILGGIGPGLLATVLSVPFTLYFIYDALKNEHLFAYILLLVVIGVSISIMGNLLTRALATSRAAAKDLKRREAHLRSILDTSPHATIVFEADGTIVTFNAAAVAQFEYQHEEAIGAPVGMLAPTAGNDALGEFGRYLKPGVQPPRGAGQALLGRRKGGSTFPMRLTVGEMSVEGSPYFTSFVEDLTEQQRAEARFAEMNSELARLARITELGEMASTLAHELNQPLSAITNYVEGCRRLLKNVDTEVAARVRDALDESARQTMRAAEIIRHQREFVARGETEKRPEDLRALIEEAGAWALIGLRARGVHRVFEFHPGPRQVWADRVQIQQVLVNLMRNAVEAMRDSERRVLVIRTRLEEHDRILVEVADSGPGIPPEFEVTLFQPFITSKPGGLGIGLAIAHRIIEAHGGELVYRRSEEGGASFRFSLPIVQEEEVSHAG